MTRLSRTTDRPTGRKRVRLEDLSLPINAAVQRTPIKARSRLLRQLFEMLDSKRVVYNRLCDVAHVSIGIFNEWKRGRATPTLVTLEGILDTIGYKLVIVKKTKEDDDDGTY